MATMQEDMKMTNLAIKMPIMLGMTIMVVGTEEMMGNQGRNQGRDERRDERRDGRRNDRRDNRRVGDQEVNGPYRRQQPPWGVNDCFRLVVTENDSPIVCERRIFDCKPHYINILPHFNGRSNDEPYTHLAEFSSICNTIGGHNFALEEVKLRLFQFSLKDKAKQWFLTLPANSIRTWGEMQQAFLDEYYSMAKTDDARDEIRSFRQLSGEPLHEAFTRFRELMRKCPHHQIEKWELVKCFVRGLDDNTWNRLESTSNGTLLSNHEDDDWEFLERMSKRSKEKESADQAKKHPISRSLPDLDSKDRISTLEREMARMKKKEVNAVQSEVCEECGDIGHKVEQCPTESSLRNHPNFQYGNASNQMNPNFQSGNQGGQGGSSYNNRQGGNQGGYQRNYNQGSNQGYQNREGNYQRGYNQGGNGGGASNSQGDNSINSKLDAIMNTMSTLTNSHQELKTEMRNSNQEIKIEMRKEFEVRDKSQKALEKQVGQLAQEMAQIRGSGGGLPSDTTWSNH
ncbi:uncharacterized protein LOC110866732 [Helianthus annuus]|uniref:uncharacterized protein LOC110866732 n=1 Tax=Helianthus annuus TaxID=4232 RepID=UPI000B8F54B2|nr:uncharacterized protein LOC110866732 [Helianthus annuus]